MPPFLYRCPNTRDSVQAWVADDPEDDDLTYLQVTSLACAQAHLVNPKTGKVLGSGDELACRSYERLHYARQGQAKVEALLAIL
jgi:hypothetical protein